MKTIRKAGWVALAGAMVTAGAQAQEAEGFMLDDVEVAEEKPFFTSEVEVGLGYADGTDFKFGEYNGLDDDGAFFIGNIDILRRGPYDGDDLSYFRARGRNLGLDVREQHVEYGVQGTYKVFGFYNNIQHNKFDDGKTVYGGQGRGYLRRPSAWPDDVSDLQAANAQDAIAEFSQRLKIENERERFGAGVDYELGGNWSVDFKAQHEDRDGTKLTAGLFGVNGGNPAAVLLPEPIDYSTDLIDAGLNYTDEKLQLRAAYSGSFFSNDKSGLRWDSLFTGGQPPGGGPWETTPDQGQLGLAPDNQAHYLSLSGGYNFTPATRVNGQVRYSWLLQDDDFLPSTINPNLANPGLPRSSLDGELRELLVDLAADSRINNKLSVRGTLRYRDSENKSSRDAYSIVKNDTNNSAGPGTADIRVNLPYEFEQTKLGLEATYRLGMMAKLKGGYRFEQIERNYQEVDSSDENTVFGRLSGTLGNNTQGWLQYTYADRDGDDYDTGKPFRKGHTSEFLDTLTPGCNAPNPPPQCENHPALRKYYEADRERNEVTGALNWFDESGFSLGFRATYRDDDYDADLGLTKQKTGRVSIEPSYQLGDRLTAYGFVAYEQLEYDQKGHEFPGFGPAQNFDDPTQDWKVDTKDKITTVGLGLTHKKIFKNTDLSLEYNYSNAKTEIGASNGGSDVFNIPAQDLPDLKSKLHRVSLRLDYAYKEDLTYRFMYAYERLRTDDFALDGVGQDSFNDVLGVNESSPDYDAHVFGVTMLYRF